MAYRRMMLSPPPAEFVAALREATREANRPQTILDFTDDWEEFVADIAGQPDGRRQWSDARHGHTAGVRVTWWTDHVGRRHVLVTGSNSADAPQRHVPTHSDPRPPLWHLYPDRVFYRQKEGPGSWWAACGCGVAGRPESIGWMGTLCGPCHDRAQEGDAADVALPTAVLTHQVTYVPPAFSPDGTRLAVLQQLPTEEHVIRVHDLSDGTHQELPTSPWLACAPAFSTDGLLLAIGTMDEALHVHDLTAGERFELSPPGFPVRRMAFSPDGNHFAACGRDGVRVWDRADGWTLLREVNGEAYDLAFSPDGEWFAVGQVRQVLLLRSEDAFLTRVAFAAMPDNEAATDLTFSPCGKTLTCLSDPARLWSGDGKTSMVRFHFPSAKVVCLGRTRGIIPNPHLSPCGRYVVGRQYEDDVAFLVDTSTGEELGRVGWDAGVALRTAVFSPDGRTLALVDVTGTVKLVPWAALLL